MCLASTYLSEIENLLDRIKKDKQKLERKKLEYDKKFSEAYHNIETAKFNACEGYYLTKNLQETLQKRRLIKSELYRIKRVYDYLKINDIKSRLPQAKSSVSKSKEEGKEWFENFDISFIDIESEVFH